MNTEFKSHEQSRKEEKQKVDKKLAGISRYCEIMALLTLIPIIGTLFVPLDLWLKLVLIFLWGIVAWFHHRLSVGLTKRKRWSSIAAIIYGYLALPGLPLWTIVGLYMIYSVRRAKELGMFNELEGEVNSRSNPRIKKIMDIVVCVIIILSIVISISASEVHTNADWRVFAYNSTQKKELNTGRFYALGRYYSESLDGWEFAYFVYDGEEPQLPLFLVVSDFPVPSKGNEGGWGTTGVEACFKWKQKMIQVPVDLPGESFLFKLPDVKGNNVFILKSDGSLNPLPYRLRSMEHMNAIEKDIIRNPNCENYIEELIIKLKALENE